MFTEDYLMRMINQALAVLMTAIGLRKSGKYSEALQSLQQAIEQLTTLPANIIDQMEDSAVLAALSSQGQIDVGRLEVLADLYQEQGEAFLGLDQASQAAAAFARALRFFLETSLAGDSSPSADEIARVNTLLNRSSGYPLPAETQLALSDHYRRVLELDEAILAAAGTSRRQVEQLLSGLEDQLGLSGK